MGDATSGPILSFNARLRVEFRGTTVTSDAGLLLPRELDERLGQGALIERHLTDPRSGRPGQMFRRVATYIGKILLEPSGGPLPLGCAALLGRARDCCSPAERRHPRQARPQPTRVPARTPEAHTILQRRSTAEATSSQCAGSSRQNRRPFCHSFKADVHSFHGRRRWLRRTNFASGP